MSQQPRDFGFGEDEALLRDLARKFLDENLPVQTLRDLVASDSDAAYERGEPAPWDEGLWKQIVELGWPGLPVPESAGGLGLKMVALAGLVEEVGRHALPSPLVASLCASLVLREAELAAAGPWLGRLADGSPMTLATTDARGSWEPEDTGVVATPTDGGVRLDGAAHFVQDGLKAAQLVVHARDEADGVLVVVPVETAGLSIAQDHIVDLTRDQATVRFDGVEVGADGIVSREGASVLARAHAGLLVTVAADLCGSGEWLLQTTVEYAKTRKQFDRPIGFFQAVKHPLVDGMILLDRARSLLYAAACALDVGDPDALDLARMAKSAASDAGAHLGDRAVQLHGGIGFTWECDVHLFFKRNLHDQALYGDGVHQRRELADSLIGPIS